MVKKAIMLIIAGYFISLTQSCCVNEYNCKWTGFNIQAIDNSGKEPIVRFNYINKKALGFRISMTDTILHIAQRSNIIAECRATSCGIRLNKLHTMTSIVIKTIYDYSEVLPAGSDITFLFKARNAEKIKEDYVAIDDIISYINNTEISYGQKTDDFDLYLIDDTCTGGLQKFEIRIFLSDGAILVKWTDNLLLQNQ